MKWMILFTEMIFIFENEMGMGEKPKEKRKQKKKIPAWLPSHPFFYDMAAHCFPVPDNAENKPDLLYVGGG